MTRCGGSDADFILVSHGLRHAPGSLRTLYSLAFPGREFYEHYQSDRPTFRVIRATEAKEEEALEEEAEDTSPDAAGKAKPGDQEIVVDPSVYATASNLIHQEEQANVHGLKDRVTCGVFGKVIIELERRRETRA